MSGRRGIFIVLLNSVQLFQVAFPSSNLFFESPIFERCHLILTITSPLWGSKLVTVCISQKNTAPSTKGYSYLLQIVMYWNHSFYLAFKVLITKKTGRSITTWWVTNCFCFSLQPSILLKAHSKVHLTISDIVFNLRSQQSGFHNELKKIC